jgi:putative DNA primase/helicase
VTPPRTRDELVATARALPERARGEPVRAVLGALARAGLDDLEVDEVLAELKARTGARLDSLKKTLKRLMPDPGNEDYLAEFTLDTRFAGGRHLVHTAPAGFYAYDGRRWREQPDAVMDRVILEATLAAGLGTPERSRFVRGVKAQLKARCARADFFPLTRPPAPLINVRNGTLEIAEDGTFVFREHRPEDALLHRLDVVYDPAATCPLFDRFLDDLFAPVDARGRPLADPTPEQLAERDDLVRHVLELLAYTIQPARPIRVFVLLVGRGANGKSALLRVLQALIGEHAVVSTKIEKLEHDRFLVGRLPGVLLLVDDDVKLTVVLPDGTLKSLAEGKLLTGEAKYQPHFNFEARVVPFLLANHYPKIADTGEAIADRAHVVPFRRVFAREGRDVDLPARIIKEELPGVLNRLLGVLPTVLGRGRFEEPEACLEAKREWLRVNDALATWFDHYCEAAPGASERVEALRRSFCDYCQQRGIAAVVPEKFGPWLVRRLGLTDARVGKDGAGYHAVFGIRLCADAVL